MFQKIDRIKSLKRCLTFALASACVISAQAATTLPARAPTDDCAEVVRAVAAKLQWCDRGFIYDRPPMFGPDVEKAVALYLRLRGDPPPPSSGPARHSLFSSTSSVIKPGPWTLEQIRPLLHDADPKVRTLAIVLAYQLNRFDALIDLADLLPDTAPTFSNATSTQALTPDGPHWFMEPQKVSDFAQAAISSFLSEANDDAAQKAITRESLTVIAAAHATPLDTATLMIALKRAGGGMSPMPADRVARVEAVEQLCQQVEMPRRFFLLHHLLEVHRDERYSPDYLLTLARELPRDIRFECLHGDKLSIDIPKYDRAAEFLADHAADLFKASDADEFITWRDQQLASDEWGGRQLAARFAIIAAVLRPAEADSILTETLEQKDPPPQNSEDDAGSALAAALATMGNDQSFKRAVDWFYKDRPHPRTYGSGRERLLGAVAAKSPIRSRRLIEAIIRDPRLNTLGPASTRTMIQSVQGYLGRSLTTEDEIRASYRIDEVQQDRQFSGLHRWQTELQQTVDEWSQPSATSRPTAK